MRFQTLMIFVLMHTSPGLKLQTQTSASVPVCSVDWSCAKHGTAATPGAHARDSWGITQGCRCGGQCVTVGQMTFDVLENNGYDRGNCATGAMAYGLASCWSGGSSEHYGNTDPTSCKCTCNGGCWQASHAWTNGGHFNMPTAEEILSANPVWTNGNPSFPNGYRCTPENVDRPDLQWTYGLNTHSKGDPHLKNVKGDKFDVKRQGSAPLLKISGDSGDALLQIMGRIQGASKCAKVTMITALNISGSWLEKNVEVKVGDQSDKALHVTVDGQQVWSAGPNAPEYKDRMDFNAARAEDKYKRNFVFNNEADKFFVEELDTSKTSKTDPGIQIAMSSNPNLILKINRPMRQVASLPHLNLDVQGLGRISPSLKVGGLLGTDDHSNWIHESEECKNFAITSTSEKSILDGSIATASY